MIQVCQKKFFRDEEKQMKKWTVLLEGRIFLCEIETGVVHMTSSAAQRTPSMHQQRTLVDHSESCLPLTDELLPHRTFF